MNQVRARKVLGVKAGDPYEIIKSRYRSLAMQHHPDRKGGDGEKFKEVNKAYEILATSLDDPNIRPNNLIVKVSLNEAFTGGSTSVVLDGVVRTVDYPILEKPYTVLEYTFNEVKYTLAFIVEASSITWDSGEFRERTKGDISTTVDVSPFTLIMGGWFKYTGFDLSESKLYIPAGCASGSILTVKNKGYWKNVDENTRGDCFLRIVPMIKKLEEYSSEEINAFKERLNSV